MIEDFIRTDLFAKSFIELTQAPQLFEGRNSQLNANQFNFVHFLHNHREKWHSQFLETSYPHFSINSDKRFLLEHARICDIIQSEFTKNMAKNLIKCLFEPTFIQQKFAQLSWFNTDQSHQLGFAIIKPFITNDFSKNILVNELMLSNRWQILGNPTKNAETRIFLLHQ